MSMMIADSNGSYINDMPFINVTIGLVNDSEELWKKVYEDLDISNGLVTIEIGGSDDEIPPRDLTAEMFASNDVKLFVGIGADERY